MDQPNFSYYNTVDQIYHAEWSTAKLARLALLRESVEALWPDGHPTRLVHVAGTGGKGSTCRFLEVGFGCVGRAGACMSPHLFDYRERFSIDGQFVAPADVTEAWESRIRPHCVRLGMRGEQYVHSFHEVTILMALALFERHEVQWAAMETGIGGRYDQTRALDVVATVLTNVGSDHAHVLGREPWQRALDKSGIARRGVPFYTTETHAAPLQVVRSVCDQTHAPLHQIVAEDVHRFNEQVQEVTGNSVPDESLLSAGYQRWNAALSYAVINDFCPEIDRKKLINSFLAARLPGRFWHVEENVYADIAHNAEKMRALVDELEVHFDARGKILIIGISGQRVPRDVFGALAQLAKMIIVTGASYKGQDPAKIRGEIESLTGDTPILVISDPRQALQVAKSMRQGDDVILLTGSTYMIEQVLNPDPYLRYLNGTFGWRTQTDREATGTVQLTLPKGPSIVR